MWEYVHSDELHHHGIKGMKWGVRRYQNKDGTLTRQGKRRLKEKTRELNKINESILLDRLYAQRIRVENNPSAGFELNVLSESVGKSIEKGKQIVANLQKDRLLPLDTSFEKMMSDYEIKTFNSCKAYLQNYFKSYDYNITDEDVMYFMDAYLAGAM